MKKALLLVMVFIISAYLMACGADQDPKHNTGTIEPSGNAAADEDTGTKSAAQALKEALENSSQVSASPEFIRLFYDYYRESPMELRLLPSFAEGSAPQWDGLTHFIYYFAERTPEEEAAYMVSVSSFEEAVKRFFTEFDYTHQSSGFFTFSDKGYTAIGWDDHGGKYYKLTALSEDSKGIYSAAFDGFSIAETDYMGEEPSVNMKAVKAKAEALGGDTSQANLRSSVDEAMLGLFLEQNYPGALVLNETVEIKFKLSDDPEYPFVYLSCARNILKEN